MKTRFDFSRAFALTVSLLAVSCGAREKSAQGQPEVPSLDYVGKLCNLESARDIEVTDDGLILAHSSGEGGASPIFVYTAEGAFRGTFASNGAEIAADAMWVDGQNRVCALDREAGTVRRFATDGTALEAAKANDESREFPLSDSGIALLDDGTFLVATVGIPGRLEIAALDGALMSVLIPSVADLGPMIDSSVGADAGKLAAIQAIATGRRGETLVVITFGEGPYDRNDGILELGADFSLVRYAGGGQFNGPEDVSVDANGYRYVADTWNRRLCAYDADWKLVAVSARDRRGKPLVVNPHCVRVKGDDVYVVAYGKERTFEAAALHRFKAFRPES